LPREEMLMKNVGLLFLSLIFVWNAGCGGVKTKSSRKYKSKDTLNNIQIDEKDRLDSLARLRKLCEEKEANAKKRSAMDSFSEILEQIRKTTDFEAVPEEGSQVEMDRNQTIRTCEVALRSAIGELAEALRSEIDDSRVKYSPRRVKRRIRRVEQMRFDLVQTGAGTIFEGIADPFDEILRENGIVPEKIAAMSESSPREESKTETKEELKGEPADIKKDEPTATAKADIKKDEPVTTAKASPVTEQEVGPTSLAEDREFLKNAQKSCKEQTKNIERVKSKIQSHSKKGNYKKVQAYQSKLDKIEQEFNSLKERIGDVASKTQLPKEELDALLKELAEAGCS